MICKKCEREIGPETLKCPYCGADNPFAVRHAENMKQYKAAFGKTASEVRGEAEKTGGLAKRAVILITLLLGCMVMIFIAAINYADRDPDDKARRDGVKNAAEYAKEAEVLLESGEYTEYVSFLYAHELMNFPPEEFDRFKRVSYVAREYYNCISEMEEMILRSTDPEYFDSLDSDISIFCMVVEEFYTVLEAQRDGETNETYASYLTDMEKELRAAMRTYFSMDDQELDAFLSLSQAQKGVKLEEILRHE